jgi:hypothetical protein
MELYFNRLGLTASANLESIKKAYAAKLKTVDLSDVSAFQEIREAYLALCQAYKTENPATRELSPYQLPEVDSLDEDLPNASDFRELIEELACEIDNSEFKAADWLLSQPALDSLQARADFSVVMLHEFMTGSIEWPYNIMREISDALSWHDINGVLRNHLNLLVPFQNYLDEVHFHSQVLAPIHSYFRFQWPDQYSAISALRQLVPQLECDAHWVSELFLRKTMESNSSAPIAALAAFQFFQWQGLGISRERPLELALAEARFREKLLLTKPDQPSPSGAEEYAIWRLKQPFNYQNEVRHIALNPIDAIFLVIQKVEVYGAKGMLNEEQVRFYSVHFKGSPEHHSHRAIGNTRLLWAILIPLLLLLASALSRHQPKFVF